MYSLYFTQKSLSAMVPDNIVVLILLKLPPKSLMRFKSVSTAWKDVITGQSFVERWNNLHSVVSGGSGDGSYSFLVLHDRWEPKIDKRITIFSVFSHVDDVKVKLDKSDTFRLPFLSLDGLTDREKILDNPLIYPAGLGTYCIFKLRHRKLALWNPTTRELKRLPFSPFDSKQKRNKYIYGFAQAEYNKEGVFNYKIGLLRHRRLGNDPYVCIVTVELYSSSERSWKRLKDCYRYRAVGGVRTSYGWMYGGSNLNGKFHWLNWLSREDIHIGTFDLTTEQFGRVEVPAFMNHTFDYSPGCSIVTKFDGKSLCLLLFRGGDCETYIDLWVMKEYGIVESWTKRATAGPISRPDYVDLLGVSDGIKGLFFQSVDRSHGDGLFFCPYGSNESVEFLPIDSITRERVMIVEHKESIVPLNGTSDFRIKRLISHS